LYGSGANGKSLFLEAVQMIFGDALNLIPLHRLAERFEVVYLQNKLINICGDIDAKYMTETGTLKALIAGDKLRGEIKFGASYNYRPVARLIFSANTLPHTSDKTAAWYSRWQFIEFPKTFPVNPGFTRKMKEEFHRERSGIFNWALEGLDRLRANGNFTSSEAMKLSANDYRMENDNVAAFVDSVLELVEHTGMETTVPTIVMHNLYRDWIETHMTGSIAVGQIEFTKRVKALGISKDMRPVTGQTTKKVNSFLGVRVSRDYKTLYDMYQRNFASGG
jgi:putative DNA primase/helicase